MASVSGSGGFDGRSKNAWAQETVAHTWDTARITEAWTFDFGLVQIELTLHLIHLVVFGVLDNLVRAALC
jgi:hypothetical protein